jgi:hypothetical protein
VCAAADVAVLAYNAEEWALQDLADSTGYLTFDEGHLPVDNTTHLSVKLANMMGPVCGKGVSHVMAIDFLYRKVVGPLACSGGPYDELSAQSETRWEQLTQVRQLKALGNEVWLGVVLNAAYEKIPLSKCSDLTLYSFLSSEQRAALTTSESDAANIMLKRCRTWNGEPVAPLAEMRILEDVYPQLTSYFSTLTSARPQIARRVAWSVLSAMSGDQQILKYIYRSGDWTTTCQIGTRWKESQISASVNCTSVRSASHVKSKWSVSANVKTLVGFHDYSSSTVQLPNAHVVMGVEVAKNKWHMETATVTSSVDVTAPAPSDAPIVGAEWLHVGTRDPVTGSRIASVRFTAMTDGGCWVWFEDENRSFELGKVAEQPDCEFTHARGVTVDAYQTTCDCSQAYSSLRGNGQSMQWSIAER